jgi:DNA-directed RNA polymerase specialized sigma54-like protein
MPNKALQRLIRAEEMRAAMREIVDNEDKVNPYTDSALVILLRERGFKNASRYGVVYHRNQEGIPGAPKRRKRASK